MARYEKIEHEDGQWSEAVAPATHGYKLACCDCGLVHDIEFDAVRVVKEHPDGSFDYKELDPSKYRVVFRARRNKRSTALVRRWKRSG